jgi:hypothetical protein
MDTLVFSFWLTEEDLQGPLSLKLNKGSLVIRSGSKGVTMADGGFRVLNSSNW